MIANNLVFSIVKVTHSILYINESCGIDMKLNVLKKLYMAILACLEPTYHTGTDFTGHLLAHWTLAD